MRSAEPVAGQAAGGTPGRPAARAASALPRDPFPDRVIRPRRSAVLLLGLRNLYILPTGFGWLWLLCCVVLYLLAINGGSNGALLLAYGGVGLFLLAPYLTQFNLQGLELRCGTPEPGFASERLPYPLLASSSQERLQLRARFRGAAAGWSGSLQPGHQPLALPWQPARRGLQRPGRLRLEATAPLGLFVCWTLWEPETPQLIYPARRPGPVATLAAAQGELEGSGGGLEEQQGSEEWRELGPHRPEEGPTRLAWKQLARSGTRLSKRFSDPQPGALLLAPDPAVPYEQALEHLCERLCRLAAAGEAFGVALERSGGEPLVIPPATGAAQLQRCLEALALAPGAGGGANPL